MLPATAKIGSKYLVHIEVLKALGAELEKLPEKEKVMLDFKSAVVFLRPFLELAVKKNYSKDEIFQLMGKVGWSITQNTFKYFWSLYLLEEENSTKKKHNPKSAGRVKNETSHVEVSQDKTKATDVAASDLSQHESKTDEHAEKTPYSSPDTQILDADKDKTKTYANESPSQHKSEDFPAQLSGAHFVLPPDTEDL